MGPIAEMPSLLRTKAIASLCSDNTSKIDAMVCRNNLEEQEEEPQSRQQSDERSLGPRQKYSLRKCFRLDPSSLEHRGKGKCIGT